MTSAAHGGISPGGSVVLMSTVATLHDNAAHGEDNYLARALGDNAVLDAVMDGVTRRRGGQASQSVVEALAAAPLTSADDVVAVLQDVNEQLYEIGAGRFLLTTVSAGLYLNDKLSIIGVGDSPIFLIRSDSHQQLSSRLRGVFVGGSQRLVNLYRAEVAIEPGDRLVLATDGITDNVTSRELAEIIRSAASPDAAVARLSALIMNRRVEGHLPAPLEGGFRDDDRTAIVRFFSP
jgi:serine/threonine protein phosphatase PrpC